MKVSLVNVVVLGTGERCSMWNFVDLIDQIILSAFHQISRFGALVLNL